MDLARCDECCAKLDGIDGNSVYLLDYDASLLFLEEYEHLCEDCMDGLNSDEEKLFLDSDNIIKIIDKYDAE